MISGRKRLISDGEPRNIVLHGFTTTQIASGTTEFFEENFNGAINCKTELGRPSNVMISPDGLAFFFKYLLNAIFGHTVVNVGFLESEGEFLVTTAWRVHRELSSQELHELKMIAYAAGFTADFSSDGDMRFVTLKTKSKFFEEIYVYAKDHFNIKNAFSRVFFSL